MIAPVWVDLTKKTVQALERYQYMNQVAEFAKCAGKTIQMTINAQMKTVRE